MREEESIKITSKPPKIIQININYKAMQLML